MSDNKPVKFNYDQDDSTPMVGETIDDYIARISRERAAKAGQGSGMKINSIDFGKMYNTRIKHVMGYLGIETTEQWLAMPSRERNSICNLGKKSVEILNKAANEAAITPPFWHSSYYGAVIYR